VLEELQIAGGAEVKQSGKVGRMTGRPHQNAAVLENCALPAALSTADNLETGLMHDVVGITAKKAKEVLCRGCGIL